MYYTACPNVFARVRARSGRRRRRLVETQARQDAGKSHTQHGEVASARRRRHVGHAGVHYHQQFTFSIPTFTSMFTIISATCVSRNTKREGPCVRPWWARRSLRRRPPASSQGRRSRLGGPYMYIYIYIYI